MTQIDEIPKLTINVGYYRDVFRTRLGADMISLRTLISAINNKTYANFRNHESKGMTFQSALPQMNERLIEYEVVKTFISMMRNVNDYLDRMVSVVRLYKKTIKIPLGMTKEQSEQFTNWLVDSELIEYCQQTREEMKDKLKYFSDLSPDFIKYMTTYNLLRNCYEHHKAISYRGLQIPIKRMGLYTNDGKEIKIGEEICGPTTIVSKFVQKTIHVKKGQPALLSYEDLASTEIYLLLEVPAQIEENILKLFQNKKS